MARGSRKQDVPPRAAARKPEPAPACKAEPPEPARNYAPRGIAALLAPVVRPSFRKRAPAAAHLLADWDSLAGPQLAARATPVKFAGGTLTLACAGPAAMELQHLGPEIIGRLNQAIGQAIVERLRFIQKASTPDLEAALRTTRTPAAPSLELPEGPLGAALAKLYQGIKPRA
jgi:hypothetical protein